MKPDRSLELRPQRLPGFLCLGTQRGGTTTLQKLLERHPQVFLPACKEVHYFSLHADRGPGWYGEHFQAAAPQALCGEITPYYLFHPQAPRRIQALLPQVRLIVLLRDPVERSLSQYFHSLQLGLEDLPLEQALTAEVGRLAGAEAILRSLGGRHRSHQEHSYLSRSRYGQQLSRYEALFSRRQLLVLRSEDLFERPAATWRTLQRFLDLDRVPLPPLLPRANASGGASAQVPEAVRQSLRRQLQPTYGLLERFYGLRWRLSDPRGRWPAAVSARNGEVGNL
jgi:hypothetical protein